MISIVMAYRNRLHQLRETLNTITFSKHTNFEIIIVDDFSNHDHSLDAIGYEFAQLDIKIVKMSDLFPNKWYTNPCVAYNAGFRMARGEKIIIQNPECMHIGDLLTHVENNLDDSKYLVFNCYAMDHDDTHKMYMGQYTSFRDVPPGDGGSCWYNHHVIRPVMYHFASALTKKNLHELGGFDELYAVGNGFDDDEFLYRIKLKKLNIEPVINDCMVIHQWHETAFNHSALNLIERNRSLWNQITTQSNNSMVKNHEDLSGDWKLDKIPKIAHFYWGGAPLSYFRFKSIKSFADQNPDWTINLHTTPGINKNVSWNGPEQKTKYTGPCYMANLGKIGVNLITHDLRGTKFENAHHVHISDHLRWKLLYEVGGLWADSDILFFRSMNNIAENNIDNANMDVFLCPFTHYMDGGERHTIGFLLSAPGNNFYKWMYHMSIDRYDPTEYQSIGSALINFRFPNLESLRTYFVGVNIAYMNEKVVYPINAEEIDYLYSQQYPYHNFMRDAHTVGVHWFGGYHASTNFEMIYRPGSDIPEEFLMSKIVKSISK